MRIISDIARNLWVAAKNVLPLIAVLVGFQTLVLKKAIPDWRSLGIGLVFVILGLFFFLKGISLSLLPLGGEVGRNLVELDSKYLIIGVAFILGYASTLVEPGPVSYTHLDVYKRQVEGKIYTYLLCFPTFG